jgi:hypothetical protein
VADCFSSSLPDRPALYASLAKSVGELAPWMLFSAGTCSDTCEVSDLLFGSLVREDVRAGLLAVLLAGQGVGLALALDVPVDTELSNWEPAVSRTEEKVPVSALLLAYSEVACTEGATLAGPTCGMLTGICSDP